MCFITLLFLKPVMFLEESISQHPASTATANANSLSRERLYPNVSELSDNH